MVLVTNMGLLIKGYEISARAVESVGGFITSSQEAVRKQRNVLFTEFVSFFDLVNEDESSSHAASVGLSATHSSKAPSSSSTVANKSSWEFGPSKMPMYLSSDEASSSVTRSIITEGNLSIKRKSSCGESEDAPFNLEGLDVTTTSDELSGAVDEIESSYNPADTQAKFAIITDLIGILIQN